MSGEAAATSDLIAAAVHRMSQPLTVLRGTVELALRRGATAEDRRASLEVALRETERLTALLEALRALAGSEPAASATPQGLREAAALVAEELAPLAAARGIRLEAGAELSAPPRLESAPRALCQALLDLAGAALDRAQTRLQLRARIESDAAAIEIEDDGAPLAAADWPRLFDPFAANADIRRALRHAAARRVLEAAGGGVWAGAGRNGANLVRVTLAAR